MKRPGLLARAALAVVLALTVWWVVLRTPSAWLMQALVHAPLALFVAPRGLPALSVNQGTREWIFNVEVAQPGVQSVEFAAEPGTVDDFTAGWFTFLALTLVADPLSRSGRKALARGMLLQLALSVLDFTLFVWVSGRALVLGPGDAGLADVLKVAEYLLSGVVPTASAFAVALAVNPVWSGYFGSWTGLPKKAST